MKTTLIASALITLTVAASSSAFAQRDEHSNDRNYRNAHIQQQDSYRYDRNRNDSAGVGSSYQRVDNHSGYAQQDHQDRKQYGYQDRDWHRSQYVRNDYRNGYYHHAVSYVHDHHERAPHWDNHRDHNRN